jgi:hypothetical protein
MLQATKIYDARVSNKRLRIYHRFFNGRNEFAVSITGGKWHVNTLYGPGLGSKIKYMRDEVTRKHPRAKWHVIVDHTNGVPA